MIVIYTSIIDHILKLQEQSTLSGRAIDYLVLTESEIKELNTELGPAERVEYNPDIIMGTLFGIQIAGLRYHTDLIKEKRAPTGSV